MDTKPLTKAILQAVIDRKATAIRVIQVANLLSYCEYFIICSGVTARQVRAIAGNVMMDLKKNHQVLPKGIEGRDTDQWVLVDFGDVVLHVFSQEARGYYTLDQLWMDAPQVALSEFDIHEAELEASLESLLSV